MTTSQKDDESLSSKFWSCYFISNINAIAILFFLTFGILTNFLFLFKPVVLSTHLTQLLLGFMWVPFVLKMLDAFLIQTQLDGSHNGILVLSMVVFAVLQFMTFSTRKFQNISTVMMNNLKRILVHDV